MGARVRSPHATRVRAVPQRLSFGPLQSSTLPCSPPSEAPALPESVRRNRGYFSYAYNYLVPRARAMGIKKIVIPGGPSGGAQTNRPDIELHVGAKYCGPNGIKVPMQADRDTAPEMFFNYYDIKDNCFLVRDLSKP